VTFERAGHSIYDEDPNGFFAELRDFVERLTDVDTEALARYSAELADWREAWKASPAYTLRAADWGRGASEAIAEAFEPSWIEATSTFTDLLRLGFALYDVGRYDEARGVFAHFRSEAERESEPARVALASIWEAHMLDLLGRRTEAAELYQAVADMDLVDNWSHGQYGMRYDLSPYAAERLETPFRRIENRQR
jgi:hypothetical protein